MREVTGIVLKVKKDTCIVATRSGEFHEVPLPDRVPLVGEEITVTMPAKGQRRFQTLRYAGVAVVFLLLLSVFFTALDGGFLMPEQVSAKPVAHVAVDANPSLELGIGPGGAVLCVEALNTSAEKLRAQLSPAVCGEQLSTALHTLTDAFVEAGYLSPETPNVILMSLVVSSDIELEVSPAAAVSAVRDALNERSLDGFVHMQFGQPQELQQAHQAGLSLNRFLLQRTVRAHGHQLSAEEAAELPLTSILAALGPEQLYTTFSAVRHEDQYSQWSSELRAVLERQSEERALLVQQLQEWKKRIEGQQERPAGSPTDPPD
jgi:hypothetical protein